MIRFWLRKTLARSRLIIGELEVVVGGYFVMMISYHPDVIMCSDVLYKKESFTSSIYFFLSLHTVDNVIIDAEVG